MAKGRGVTRRELLGAGLAAGLPWPAALASGRVGQPVAQARDDHPKNIIFMVSDGMSAGVLSLVEPFSQLVRRQSTCWYRLLQAPETVHGGFEMHSLNSMVTDSAAASTAWSSGSRVFNGSINVLPDGTRLTPIAPLVRATGRRIGLVTTTQICHATPAGFAAVQPRRDDMNEIAPQYLDLVDVALGGGREHFVPALRSDHRNLVETFEKSGYVHCATRDELLAVRSSDRILGLFGQGHVPYTIDRDNDAELKKTVPTLGEMTRAALRALSHGDRGFLLQVEGGRVDHAAHANDAAAMLWDQLAFDDAVGVVLEFVETNPDTLVVVTTDHGNSNPGLNGMGSTYRNSNQCFEQLAKARASFGVIRQRLQAARAGTSAERVIEGVRECTGIELTRSEARVVAAALSGGPLNELNRQHANFVGTLGQALGNHNGIGWTGITHTADFVVSMAMGPGKHQFAGLLRNVDAFGRLTALAGVSHCNPALSPSEARRFAVAESPATAWHTSPAIA